MYSDEYALNNTVEIFCDASIKHYNNNRTFGCAGALSPILKLEKYEIVPDTTNNKSEITALYLAVQMAKEIRDHHKEYDDIVIYSDSKLAVFGLKHWMDMWLQTRVDGVMYNTSGKPVANQDLYLRIIRFLVENNLKIKLRHQKGHVKVLKEHSMNVARQVFYESNDINIGNYDLSRICFYNNKIDELTRNKLETINPNNYPIIPEGIAMITYVPPANYLDYIN